MKGMRGIILGTLMGLGLAPGLCAQQDYPYAVPQYEMVDYAANVLQLPSGPEAFAKFYAKMDALLFQGTGQVNIVHIGGSHVQADMWTDRMRQRMQTFYPGIRGGRGMLFPFRMARTNNPYNFQPEYSGTWEACKNIQANRNCTLGLTGYAVTTWDTATRVSISFRGEGYPQYEFNSVRIFHDMDSTSFRPRVRVNGTEVPGVQDARLGFTQFALGTHLTRLEFEVRKTDSVQNHFTLYGISLDNGDPGVIYHAIGVNGASTGSYRRCQLFVPHLTAVNPDLVIFSVGINDANTTDFDTRSYETNYDTLVAWVRRANPDACILFTTNTDSYYKKRYPNKNAEKVRTAMLKLAKEHRAGVWDTYAVMGGLGSIKTWIKLGLANQDRVHLLRPGYELLADLLFNALMQDYDRHLREISQGGN